MKPLENMLKKQDQEGETRSAEEKWTNAEVQEVTIMQEEGVERDTCRRL